MKTLSEPPSPSLEHSDTVALIDSIRELQFRFSQSDIAKRFSDEQIELIYSVGHGLFMQGKFEKALNVFKLVMLYRPIDSRYTEAYATTLKRMGRFEEAIPVFAAAFVFGDLLQPMPAIHIAECLAALGRTDESECLVRPLLDFADVNAAYGDIRERAETLLVMLKKGGDGER